MRRRYWSGSGGENVRVGSYREVVARSASVFACSSCGHESPKWHGRCPGCGEWNTLVEERSTAPRASTRSGRAAKPVPLREVQAEQVARIGTGIAELDRVLGG